MELKSEVPQELELFKKILPERRKIELDREWDKYALAGCGYIYKVRCTRKHKEELINFFLPAKDSVYLELGPGTGILFEPIARIIQPKELHGIDLSNEMIKLAEQEAERIEQSYDTKFKLYLGDMSIGLPWPDNFFEGAVSNLVICYIQCGWKKILVELTRVIKPGSYIYLGPLTDENFIKKAIKHLAIEFFRQPIISLKALKYRKIISAIAEKAKKQEAQFPDPKELVDFLKVLGFKEIKITPTYWGGGLALRAKLNSKPSNI